MPQIRKEITSSSKRSKNLEQYLKRNNLEKIKQIENSVKKMEEIASEISTGVEKFSDILDKAHKSKTIQEAEELSEKLIDAKSAIDNKFYEVREKIDLIDKDIQAAEDIKKKEEADSAAEATLIQAEEDKRAQAESSEAEAAASAGSESSSGSEASDSSADSVQGEDSQGQGSGISGEKKKPGSIKGALYNLLFERGSFEDLLEAAETERTEEGPLTYDEMQIMALNDYIEDEGSYKEFV